MSADCANAMSEKPLFLSPQGVELQNMPASQKPSTEALVHEASVHEASLHEDSLHEALSRPPRPEWRSRSVKKKYSIFVLFLDVAIIITIIALERISVARNGIAVLPSMSPSEPSLEWHQVIWTKGLLWTTFPTFLMALYRLAWDSIVTGAADREPFVELNKSRTSASDARHTILLDYRSHPSFSRWLVAIRLGHYVLGAGMLLNLLLSIALVPLSAHLFVASMVHIQSPTTVNFTQQFDSTVLSINTSSNGASIPFVNYETVIDAASASLVHGARLPPWITPEYAFEPFQSRFIRGPNSENITVNASAFSGYLDCRIIERPDVILEIVGGTLSVQIYDRGCAVPAIKVAFGDGQKSVIYAESWSTNLCEKRTGASRIGAILGPNLGNFSIVSCIPSYWKTQGSLTVSFREQNDPEIIRFDPIQGSETLLDGSIYADLQYGLSTYKVFDPTNQFIADDFGRFIYEHLKRKLGSSTERNDSITKSAMEEVFSQLISFVNSQIFIRPRLSAPANALLSSPVTKLLVVKPIAYIIVGFLILVLICNACIIWRTETERSILREEPASLLGYAGVLDGSDITQFVADFRARHPEVDDMAGFVEKNYTCDRAKCYLDEISQKITLEGLVERKAPETNYV